MASYKHIGTYLKLLKEANEQLFRTITLGAQG